VYWWGCEEEKDRWFGRCKGWREEKRRAGEQRMKDGGGGSGMEIQSSCLIIMFMHCWMLLSRTHIKVLFGEKISG